MAGNDEEQEASKIRTVGLPAALGGAGAVAGMINPVAGVAAAVATPLVSKALEPLFRRRQAKAEAALRLAAQQARLTVEEMIERLGRSEAGDSLLMKVLRSAQEAGSQQKLLALASCLGKAAGAESEVVVTVETVLVDALSGVEEAHLRLLRCFRMTSEQLGLGTGPEAQKPVELLNKYQAGVIAPDLEPVLPAALQRLLVSGLLEADYPGGGATFYVGAGGPSPANYRITKLGGMLLDRLDEISALLGDREA